MFLNLISIIIIILALIFGTVSVISMLIFKQLYIKIIQQNKELIITLKMCEDNLTIYKVKLNEVNTELNNLSNNYNKLLGNKKSSEVNTGLVVEKLAPLLEGWHWNRQNARFIGMPIDYIIFEEEKIIFVEIKSVNSKLTSKQNKIKKIIEDGKIEFEIFRIK